MKYKIMSNFEGFVQSIYSEILKVRENPGLYAQRISNEFQYYKSKNIRHRPGTVPLQTREGLSAAEEAYQELLKLESLPLLEHSSGLSSAAIFHCADTGALGIVGHIGSKETTLQQRIEKYGKWTGGVVEALDYGSTTAFEVVLSLLIDAGLSTRPHRKALLNPTFTKVGIGAGPHSEFKTVCCIIFSAGFDENEDFVNEKIPNDPVPLNPEIDDWLEGAVKLTCEVREENENGVKVKKIKKHWEMSDGKIHTVDEVLKKNEEV